MAETAVASKSDDKMMEYVATIPGVGFIMLLAMKDAKESVKHAARQSNGILVVWIAMYIIVGILAAISFGLLACIGLVSWIVPVGAQIMLIMKINKGDDKYVLPLMGTFFDGLMK